MEISKRFGLCSNKQLRDWIKVYNGHKEFWLLGGQGSENYMTKGRSTTLEERIEITSYCIANGKDYGTTIEKYGVSYQQIYSWVCKYEAEGVDGLIDKRGKRKPLKEMTKVERLKKSKESGAKRHRPGKPLLSYEGATRRRSISDSKYLQDIRLEQVILLPVFYTRSYSREHSKPRFYG